MPAIFGKEGYNDMGAFDVLERIRERDVGSPEFLYLNLMEAHSPYRIPNSYKEVSDEKIQSPSNPVGSLDSTEEIDVDAIRTRYKNAVRYLSDVYRDIFDELRTDYDYIITLADHGELLGEHDHLKHAYGIYPELTHVPLSVYSGEGDSTRDSSLVSVLDVHRTVLDLAGVEGADSRGRNLLNGDLEASGGDIDLVIEYHGITFPRRNRKRLHEWADSKNIVDSYLMWRRGLALRGYYGYDTIEGFIEHGVEPDDDPQAKIEAVIETFDEVPHNTYDAELSTDVEQKLEDIGYIA
jgi:arylsulfatase